MNVSHKYRQIDNIEFNVDDIVRSKAFYSGAFGWTFVDYGPTYTEFSDGRLTGGFTTGEPIRPGGPLIILYSDDLDETQQRLKALGAVISRETFSFPGGSRFHFIDLDGYELAVWTAVVDLDPS
ncbi:VOC family protein [Pseudomonas syringae group genomosp. 3]|uniref:VOC family protein n=1 Tax=Pseudomonas syringae group genomosp. 3 TaxID=251701 RepID=UPI000EFE72D3|nr:VOC family protein [Pseudomonas syringae group genomosp. 3]